MAVTVRADADDRNAGMTLDELARFVQEAMRLDVPGSAWVRVVAGLRSQVQRLEVADR